MLMLPATCDIHSVDMAAGGIRDLGSKGIVTSGLGTRGVDEALPLADANSLVYL